MKSNKNKTKEMFKRVVNNVKAIVDNGDYEKFLKFQTNIRKYNIKRYSFSNLVLIFSKFPDATKVAGKSQWAKLNREVPSDAEKIWIIAPIPQKWNKKVKKIENGEEIEETQTYEYCLFRWVYVYDISQTKGEKMPLTSHYINSEDMSDFYNKLKRISHLPVIEKTLYGEVQGYYSPSEQQIVIKNTLSSNDKAAVLLHELSHAMYDDFDYKTDRELSEVFVESIAYIVADHFGLDTSGCSLSYITKWAKGDAKVVIELGNKIQECANDLIDKIEKFEMQESELVA